MKKIVLFFIALACFQVSFANEYRDKLKQALVDEDKNEELIQELEKKNSPALSGFLGVAYVMKSNHAILPWKKLKFFYKGKKLLDNAIDANPHNIELIYYRNEIQRKIPRGLNYNHLEADTAKLMDYLKDEHNKERDRDLYFQIQQLLKSKK